MIAYVICMNDKIKYVVVNDEKRAKEKMEELRGKHYNSLDAWPRPWDNDEEYKCGCFWHIHEVECEGESSHE